MKKGWIISGVITVLQFIAAAVLFFNLPERIAIHTNWSGVVDGYGGRAFIFLTPCVTLAAMLLLGWLPKMDPKRENIEKSGKIYPVMMVMVALLMLVVQATMAATALGYLVPTFSIVMALIGVLLVLIGNYLPKVKTNYVLGIRLPWTLDNELVWTKTQRFGGWVFLLMGLLFIVGAFLPSPMGFILPMAGLLVGTLVIAIYSRRIYKDSAEKSQ